MSRDGRSLEAVAVRAVDEVGNPTILATLTVIAAILPMAFVGGLMGPYMRPIPVGASAAMVFSLIVAFVVTPWAAVRLLPGRTGTPTKPEDRLTRAVPPGDAAADRAIPRRASAFLARGRDAAARRRGARAARPGHGQDAAVRQQERAAGDRAHARRHAARNHGRRRVGAGRRGAARRGGDERPELRRHVVAVHVQRARAPLLPAARSRISPTCR